MRELHVTNEWIDYRGEVLEDGSVVQLSSGLKFPSILEWLAVIEDITQRSARAAALQWDDDEHDHSLIQWQDDVVWYVSTTFSFGQASGVCQSDGSLLADDGGSFASVAAWLYAC